MAADKNRNEVYNYLFENSGQITYPDTGSGTRALKTALTNVSNAYTFEKDAVAFDAMKEGFKNLLTVATDIQLSFGTVKRDLNTKRNDSNVITSPVIDDVIDSLTSERIYQNGPVGEQYDNGEPERQPFTQTQEFTMCSSYFDKEIGNNAQLTEEGFITTARKIGAMALRSLENTWDKGYEKGMTL